MQISEADLQDHILNGNSKKSADQSANTKLAEKDYQLFAALNMLRGIHALRR